MTRPHSAPGVRHGQTPCRPTRPEISTDADDQVAAHHLHAPYAGLFCLPRLFVFTRCAPEDRVGIERFKTMECSLRDHGAGMY
jgi:hypothetical protein